MQTYCATAKNVTEIRLDPRIAETIELSLRAQTSGSPAAAAFNRALADILGASKQAETPADAEIRKAISAELEVKGGIPDALIDVSVHGGVVELRGAIRSQYHRLKLCDVANGTPGVKAIHDHLIWMDHDSGAFLLSPEDSRASNPS